MFLFFPFKVGGKGKARVPSGGTCFPSGTSMSLNEGMEEDPGTALKNAQDVILDKLYAARPNKLKDLVQPQVNAFSFRVYRCCCICRGCR